MNRILATDLYTIYEIVNAGINEFVIKSYQRGYRWDIDNIRTLVSDIQEADDNKVYCLQPLAVTKISDGCYEVIDGQQRLTTIKIIMYCLKRYVTDRNTCDYHIRYETRACDTFLFKLYSNNFQYELEDLTLENINELWRKLDLDESERNRDNFHLYQSYCTCHYLFARFRKENLDSFYRKLSSTVKFIWYEVDLRSLETTAEKLFANINKNKIRLTGADLIKALFILDIEQNPQLNLEQKHYEKQLIATQWDEIEQALHNPDFWFFITNSNDQHYDVRIGKLFDLITKNRQESDLGSYFLMKTDKGLLNWKKTYGRYKMLLEWFEDIYYYHRVGFLVNMKILTIDDIIEKYTHKTTTTKTVFKIWIEKKVRDYIKAKNLEDISYEKDKGRYGYCTGALMLYNILLTEKYYPNYKFSFGDFVECDWSLEHIQPQNPKKKNSRNWITWLEEIKPQIEEKFDCRVLHVDRDQYGVEQINYDELLQNLADIDDKEPIPNHISLQLEALQDIFQQEFPTHQLHNLALLDRVTNSKLSNGSFKEKRAIILQIHTEENPKKERLPDKRMYLPLGTINVFTKSMITDSSEIQMEYWSAKDAIRYFEDIQSILTF